MKDPPMGSMVDDLGPVDRRPDSSVPPSPCWRDRLQRHRNFHLHHWQYRAQLSGGELRRPVHNVNQRGPSW